MCSPSPTRLHVGHGLPPIMLEDGGWAVCDLAIKEVIWPATLFYLYWARWAVEEIWSDQLAGYVRRLSDFYQNFELQGNDHTEEKPILLPVSGWVIILGMKTLGQNETVYYQSAWVYWLCSSDVTWQMDFFIGTSPCGAPWWVGKIATETQTFFMALENITQAKTKIRKSQATFHSWTTPTKKKYSMKHLS